MWRQFSHLAKREPRLPGDAAVQRQPARDRPTCWSGGGASPAFSSSTSTSARIPTLAQFGPINPNLIGFVGAITAENLKDSSFHEQLPTIGTAGQAGVEKTYDRYLRGQDGQIQETVDPDRARRSARPI